MMILIVVTSVVILEHEEKQDTVMLSMVEMPNVIFSPDSAGMRKTNLRERFKVKVWEIDERNMI